MNQPKCTLVCDKRYRILRLDFSDDKNKEYYKTYYSKIVIRIEGYDRL